MFMYDLDFARERRDDRAVEQPKVSATLLAFLEPLFLILPPNKVNDVMNIAVLVWNSVVLDDHRGTSYVTQTRSRLHLIPDTLGREFMLDLVDELIDRKRREFAEHVWLVGEWAFFEQAGSGPRLRVEARHLPAPSDDLEPDWSRFPDG